MNTIRTVCFSEYVSRSRIKRCGLWEHELVGIWGPLLCVVPLDDSCRDLRIFSFYLSLIKGTHLCMAAIIFVNPDDHFFFFFFFNSATLMLTVVFFYVQKENYIHGSRRLSCLAHPPCMACNCSNNIFLACSPLTNARYGQIHLVFVSDQVVCIRIMQSDASPLSIY